MELLVGKCETSYKFLQKAPSWMFDWIINAPLQFHSTESEFRFCRGSKHSRNVPEGVMVRSSENGPNCAMINDIIVIVATLKSSITKSQFLFDNLYRELFPPMNLKIGFHRVSTYHRHIQNPVKHLRWSVLRKYLTSFSL